VSVSKDSEANKHFRATENQHTQILSVSHNTTKLGTTKQERTRVADQLFQILAKHTSIVTTDRYPNQDSNSGQQVNQHRQHGYQYMG
jgi:hypothetical protein